MSVPSSFHMEPLESVSADIRVQCIEQFRSMGLSIRYARILEHYVHSQRVKFEDGVIPQWLYGPTRLLLTDGPDRHEHWALCHYMDLVQHATARLERLMKDSSGIPDEETFRSVDFLQSILQEPDDVFCKWKLKMKNNLAFAKKILEEKESASSGIFQCGRCKSFDVDTEQKQTRSADEPMTIFCSCTSCGFKFIR